jgi:ferredoxin
MSADQIRAFAQSPYYKLSDVKMLFFFTRMTLLSAGVLSGLLILSFFFKNFWCRYLCPYGALMGLFSWISPTRVQRSESHCTKCGACDRACPSLLPVSRKESIRSPECTGCMDCVLSCPAAGALSLRTMGIHRHSWKPKTTALFIMLLFLLAVYAANLTGHWRSGISDQEFRMRLISIDTPGNTHPSINY